MEQHKPLVNSLRAIGVDAHPGQEEAFIEIRNSPIISVTIGGSTSSGGGGGVGGAYGFVSTDYCLNYWVPDPTIGADDSVEETILQFHLEVKCVRVKNFPVFGKVVDIRWVGKSSSSGTGAFIATQLSEDVSLKESLVRLNKDIRIHILPKKEDLIKGNKEFENLFFPTEENAWIINPYKPLRSSTVSSIEKVTNIAPSREEWDCYEKIAHHLLKHSENPQVQEQAAKWRQSRQSLL